VTRFECRGSGLRRVSRLLHVAAKDGVMQLASSVMVQAEFR